MRKSFPPADLTIPTFLLQPSPRSEKAEILRMVVVAECMRKMEPSSTLKINIADPSGGSSASARPPSRSYASSWHRRFYDEDEDGTLSETSADSSTEGVGCDDVRSLFAKASSYLNPGRLFRSAVYLFGERKLFVFFMMHFACTMTIWCK